MKGFIVDETYRVEGGVANVYLFGRLENGESFLTISPSDAYFYIKTADVEATKHARTEAVIRIEQTKLRTMTGEPVSRVLTPIPKDVSELRKALEEKRIQCFEADIRFTHRFLMDRRILRCIDVDGDYESDQYVNRIYRTPHIAPAQWDPQLRVLSMDIETSMRGELYSISMVASDESCDIVLLRKSKSHTAAHARLKHAKIFDDEKELLTYFRDEVLRVDPDIITGWNLIDFDLAKIKELFDKHKIPFRLGRQDWDCSLRLEAGFLKDSKAEFPGRQVIDGIQLLKNNFIKLDDYKLATASAEFLGDKKLIEEDDSVGKGKAIEDAYKHRPQELVDYNRKDSQLVLGILDKSSALGITLNRCMLTGMSMERVKGSVASFDSLYLRELAARGYVAQSSNYVEKEEGIKGGYVKESTPGIYDFIVVLDFKSLYPSILCTFNIDPLSYAQGQQAPKHKSSEKNNAQMSGAENDGGQKGNREKAHDAVSHLKKSEWIVAPNGAVFKNDDGILPVLIERLWKARDIAKRSKDERASWAIKTVMNSFWGVLANSACRFFSMEMANAITAFARHTIQLTIERVEAMGYEVIYGDTDSIFVNSKATSYEDAARISKRIEEDINQFYTKHVTQDYARTSRIELESDRIFTRFIMPRVRGSEEGAKKRYAGLIIEDGKEKLDVTGLEIVRRDWTDLAKGFQERILNLVFRKEDPSPFIRQYVSDLRDGKYDDELLYRKAIRKELDEYTKTTPPHVKAARKLEEARIALESSLIEYVMTDDGPTPKQLLKKSTKIDYDHYVEKQLKPIADAILCFYDTTFDDVVKGQKQKSLFGY